MLAAGGPISPVRSSAAVAIRVSVRSRRRSSETCPTECRQARPFALIAYSDAEVIDLASSNAFDLQGRLPGVVRAANAERRTG